MSKEIKYNSEELQEAQSIIQESERILQSDILTHFDYDFEVLKELDLFSEGLNKLKDQGETLIKNHDTFFSSLKEHDSDLTSFEDLQASQVSSYIDGERSSSKYSGGSKKSHKKIKTDETIEGTEIKDSDLKELLDNMSYEDKQVFLKSVLGDNPEAITALLTNEDNSSVLTYLLKKVLNDNGAEIGEVPTEYEKEIQKQLLESILTTDTQETYNFGTDTFLQGLPYLTQIAKQNNIDVSTMILDDKYNGILREAIKDIYDGNVDTNLTEEQINGVKSYIDSISQTSNIPVDTLLSVDNFMYIVKGGEIKS